MSWFFYWQKVGGEDAWQCALSESREQLIATERPRFVTVLDVSAAVDETFTKEQIDQLKYRGPLYFDFDGPDTETVVEKFQMFLGKLLEHDVDPNQCHLFATGGRGFHIEIPQEVFMAKVPKQGTARLPLIYKEMAFDLYVDTLDLRVYSTRKGRMWRTPGVQRENGRFKVPLTFEEAGTMTPADYEGICSAPRRAPQVAPPQLSQKMAVLFAKAEAKMEAASKRRKSSKSDAALLAKFKGEFPATLQRVMAGEAVNPGAGFHKIALQVAITGNALGKKEEEILAACEGLVEKHQSDGNRYNTPVKRRNEILRLLRYTEGNPCYEYSRDALRSIVAPGTSSPDLDGVSEEVSGEITAEGDNGNSEGLLGGVFVTEKGIFRRTETGAMMLSDISFKDINLLYHAESGAALGFEVEVLLKGRSRGRQLLDLTTFLSKQKYLQFCMGHMGVFQGNDNQASAIAAILRDTAMKNDKVVYIIHREGLDLVQRPGSPERQLDFVWVSPDAVETADSPINYKHRGSPSSEGIFKTDLTDAPDFAASDLGASVIDSLLRFNDPYAVSNLLGWFVSAFHRQIYHQTYQQFPLLQIFGQSGSGKTKTVESLLKLHYYLASPLVLQADSSTKFAIQSAMQSSASIPVVLDEFKPRQFGPGKYSSLLQMFRSAYSAQTLAKGGMAQEINTSWRDIRLFAFSSPTAFLSEAIETETAILERSIVVPISKTSLTGREEHHFRLRDNGEIVSSLGKEIVRATFAMDMDAFRELVDANQAEANKIAFKRNNHRVVFNLAVVMSGLAFLERLIAHHFGTQFNERFAELRASMLDVSKHVSITAMPEAAKVMNILSHISKTEDQLSEFGLKPGVDYILNGEHLELQMRHCYFKYVAWMRRKGQTPLYDNEEAFTHGLGNFAPVVNKACLDSLLKETGMEKIFRFSVPQLKEEGVDHFKA